MLLQLIEDHGHIHLLQLQYWSVDGPMKYDFKTVHLFLLTHFWIIENVKQLENRLDVITVQLGNLLEYLLHVGFPDN